MRICLIAGAWPPAPCGVADYTARLSAALSERGHEVLVLTAPVVEPVTAPGVEVRGEASGWTLRRLPALARAVRRLDPDVVHLQYPAHGYGRGLGVTLLLPLLRLLLPRARRIVTVHEYTSYSWRGRLRMAPMLRAAHRVLCTTHRDRRALRGLGRARLAVVPIGSNVGPDPGQEWRAHCCPESGTGTPPVWLAHFGMVMPNKGWELLLASLRDLDGPRPLGVLAAGQAAPQWAEYDRRVRERVRGSGLQDRVRFSGFVPQDRLAEVFRETCGIALLPYTGGASLNRGSLVACLAHGLAVVTTRPDAPVERLRHGENVWFADPRPEAIAAAVRKLLAEPELAERLRRGARAASERHAWPRIARRHLDLYARAGRRGA